jgi:hypothetical protein
LLKANDLLRQGRNEELWQMCCGFLYLDLDEFMEIQKNLLLNQLELLNTSPLGRKIMHGVRPKTVEEFRSLVPLTAYEDYCPELLEKREDILPSKPEMWTHSSGWSDEYNYKWVPLSADYIEQLSKILFGIGILSCCKDWGHIPQIPDTLRMLYSVAPNPYISGIFAEVLQTQTPLKYLPDLKTAENLSYEERISTGFQQALDQGMDYFFGLSLVLVKVGEKLRESSGKVNIRQYLSQPRVFWRLLRAIIKSRLAGRPILPKDLWSLKGIIGSGVDSGVYKEKIKELWGRKPLDIYSCTEGGVIATQTWDYEGMTFIPNLNFFEFIPEDELLKWQMDRSYRMKTLLLDEVEPGESYEIVITSFHGGSLVRYRVGDMITIKSLRNEQLGINIPQMVFKQRVDDVIDLYAVRLSEKAIWKAIESVGIAYEDWFAFKDKEKPVLNVYIELKNGYQGPTSDIAGMIYSSLISQNAETLNPSVAQNKLTDMANFDVNVNLLPKGTFATYMKRKQNEGADLAHLKPMHVNPTEQVLSILIPDYKETIVVPRSITRQPVSSGHRKAPVF